MAFRPRLLTPFLLACTVQLAGCGSGGSSGGSNAGTGTNSGSAALSWAAPTQNQNGTPVHLVGFNIYTGSSQTTLQHRTTVGANQTSATLHNLPTGVVYFAVTAVDANGAESDHSNVASITVN